MSPSPFGGRRSPPRACRGGALDAIPGYYAEDVRLMPEFQRTVMSREHGQRRVNAEPGVEHFAAGHVQIRHEAELEVEQ